MKKVLLIACIAIFSIALKAQPGIISINLDAGYTFGSTVNFDAAHAHVDGAFQYGGGIEYFTDFNQSVEVKYLRMDTHFPLFKPNGEQYNTGNDKGSVNYILLGWNKYFGEMDAKARPFAGIGLGAGVVSVEGNNATKFAWDAKVGVKIQASPVVSLKLQAYMQSIISTFGSDVWISGSGYVYAVPDYATLWQFGLGGVICFDFEK